MRPPLTALRAYGIALAAALAAGGLATWSRPLGLVLAAVCLATTVVQLLRLQRAGRAPSRVDALVAGALALVTAWVLPALAIARDPYHALHQAALIPALVVAAAMISAWNLAVLFSISAASEPTGREGATPSPGLVRIARVGLTAYAILLPLSIAGMQIAFGLLAIFLVVALVVGVRPNLRSPLDAPVALLAIACGISIAFSSVPTPPWETTACFAILSFFVVSRVLAIASPEGPDWLLNLIVCWAASSAVTCLLALVQRWTGFDLVARLGLRAPIQVVAPNDPGYFAGIGTFNSRLTLAHVTLLPIGMLLGFILLGAAPRRRWILTASLALGLAGLWATLARAAWLSLATVLLAAGGLAMAARRMRRVVPALIAIVGAAVLVLALSPGARQRATRLGLQENRDRLFLWARGAEVAIAHPFLGVGFGSYQRVAGPIYDRYDPAFPMRTWAHNQALSLLCETGPLGLLAYLWIFVALLGSARRALLERPSSALRRALSLGGALAATTFFVVATFHDPLYDGEVAYNLFFVLSLAGAGARVI